MLPDFGALSTVGLIFGGCCSNVFVLEKLVKSEPNSGLLITFFQFAFAALAAYPTQFAAGAPYTVRTPTIPLRKWTAIAVMFYGVNMLNNWAFAFKISVPVHIIMRSFGSVTTMLAGWLRGKSYSWLQVASVGVLTAGVVVSAWADAASKGKEMSATSPSTSSEDFFGGLAVLFVAQCLSAYMGVYVQDTYAVHGASWRENLFYAHALSLPLFAPLAPALRKQYLRLAGTGPLHLAGLDNSAPATANSTNDKLLQAMAPLLGFTPPRLQYAPRGIVFLVLNALTQLVCISGVNVLSAQASAVTVTIVLNIRKLVSFMLSTWLFGHELSGLMVVGAALVFGSGALYGWETSWRIPREKERQRAKTEIGNGGVRKD